MNDTTAFRRIEGSCHCGNIRFTLNWPDPSQRIPARACGCGHCTKHGAAWTSNPNARFSLLIADPTHVAIYRFGTKTADFHVCTTCGVTPIVTWTIEGVRRAVFNIRTFDGFDRSELVETATDFEAESLRC